MLPQARDESLAVEELTNETLVYDLDRDRVHCLNRTASLVWRQCDGRTTVAEMAARVGEALDLPADESLVWLALRRLERAHLLAGAVPRPAGAPSYTRREVARRLGLAGGLTVLLPLLTSVTAPTPGYAQSPGTLLQQPSPPTGNNGNPGGVPQQPQPPTPLGPPGSLGRPSPARVAPPGWRRQPKTGRFAPQTGRLEPSTGPDRP